MIDSVTNPCDLLAAFLEYPGEGHGDRLAATLPVLADWCPEAGASLSEFARAIEGQADTELEELYTRTFDINPTCTLELGWHLYGEQYERGAFLVQMRDCLRRLGVPESAELPDHLGHALQALGRMSEQEAEAFAEDRLLPALEKMRAGFQDPGNPYTAIITAICTAAIAKFAPAGYSPPADSSEKPRGGGPGADPSSCETSERGPR